MARFKKYVVFRYDHYYPGGGTSDIEGSFGTLNEVQTFLNEKGYIDSVEVIDRDTWEEIGWRYNGSKYTIDTHP